MDSVTGTRHDDAQRELDLGITPKAVKAEMVSPPAATLFTDAGAVPAPRQLVARPRVLKSCSGLLYDALAGVYADLGFDAVGDEVFRDLVIARVVEPTSLLDVDRVLTELGRTCASLSTRKRTLRRTSAGGYCDQIAAACFQTVCATGDLSLVLYDVTTLLCRRRYNRVMPIFRLCRCPGFCAGQRRRRCLKGRHI